jgi:hypothetical protein
MIECEFMIAIGYLEISSMDFSRMYPPRVGALSRVDRNTRSSDRVTKIGTEDMPKIVDVDEIHTPEYEPHTTQVEEEINPSQETEKLEEDTERIESDVSKGKGPQ